MSETAQGHGSTTGPRSRSLPVVLALLTMAIPLAINLSLPVLPEIAVTFGVDVPRIQASLGLFLLGLAAGQFGGAPVSDRYGRRCTALWGTAVFGAATVGVLLSESADQFIALRAVQGLGAGVAFVNVGAVVGDLFDSKGGARMLSGISAIQALPRLVGPACGAALAAGLGWRSTFHALLVYCVVLGWAVWLWLPETVADTAASRERPLLRQAIRGYRRAFGHTRALGYLFCLSFSTACIFVFLNDGPFIYTVWFGLSPGRFSGFLAANVVALVMGTLLNFRLLGKHAAHRIALFACAGQCLVAVVLLAHVTLMTPAFPLVATLLMMSCALLGLTMGNTVACFLECFSGMRGTASGVAGSSQFLLGGAIGTGLNIVHTGTLATTAVAFSLCGFVAMLALSRAGPGASEA